MAFRPTFYRGSVGILAARDTYPADDFVRTVLDSVFQAPDQATVGVWTRGQDSLSATVNLAYYLSDQTTSCFNGLDANLESVNANGVTSGHLSTSLA